jgi:hypothetical protein
MAMQMSRQPQSCAFSVYAEKLLEHQWVRDRCLASKGATHVGCGLPSHQATILQQRDPGTLWTGRAQGHDLEGPVAIADEAQQGLRVSGFRITDNGNPLRLGKGIGQRLEPLAEP